MVKKSKMMHGVFKADDLVLVGRRTSHEQASKFKIGDRVWLASGSPDMLVVDCDEHKLTVAWMDGLGAREWTGWREMFVPA